MAVFPSLLNNSTTFLLSVRKLGEYFIRAKLWVRSTKLTNLFFFLVRKRTRVCVQKKSNCASLDSPRRGSVCDWFLESRDQSVVDLRRFLREHQRESPRLRSLTHTLHLDPFLASKFTVERTISRKREKEAQTAVWSYTISSICNLCAGFYNVYLLTLLNILLLTVIWTR